MLDFILNLFKKEQNNDHLTNIITKLNDQVNEDEFILPEVVNVNEFDRNRPTLLIMDDYYGMIDMVITGLNKELPDLFDTVNVVTATTPLAAFSVEKYIQEYTIDYAILDITLNGIEKGSRRILDGVDVFFMLKEANQNFCGIFLTAHTLNKKNPVIFDFMKKYKAKAGTDIDSKVMDKMYVDYHKISKMVWMACKV